MCRLTKAISNKANPLNSVIPRQRVILEKHVNHKTYITFHQPLISIRVSYRSLLKACQLFKYLVQKIYLSICSQFMTIQPDQQSGLCVRSKFFFLLCWSIRLSPLIDMQQKHIQKLFLTF